MLMEGLLRDSGWRPDRPAVIRHQQLVGAFQLGGQ